MRWLSILNMRFKMLFRRGNAAFLFDAELRDHLDRQIAENLAAGLSPADARSAALRAFGNPALLSDQARATWGWAWLESLLRDLRYAARTLRRTPGFAARDARLLASLKEGARRQCEPEPRAAAQEPAGAASRSHCRAARVCRAAA